LLTKAGAPVPIFRLDFDKLIIFTEFINEANVRTLSTVFKMFIQEVRLTENQNQRVSLLVKTQQKAEEDEDFSQFFDDSRSAARTVMPGHPKAGSLSGRGSLSGMNANMAS
jgi:hypothetical protein|tara:strand:+ start:583 stop:915 length:333 start_codon:yes stop_codon:yes gene_type:complete